MKISTVVLIVLTIVTIYAGFSKQRIPISTLPISNHIHSVSDAKELALRTGGTDTVVNVRGVFYGDSLNNRVVVQLEDEAPTGLEDILLYCSFSKKETNEMKLKPGAEITVCGKLNKKSNYIELTECRLICINEVVLIDDFTKMVE